MPIALTRAPTAAIRRCELTHLAREAIDVDQARRQHRLYEEALEFLGCRVERLPELPEQPDAVFVEDTAVVLPELAVITRPGAVSRRPETQTMATALAPYRTLEHLRAPATLDGGDVLCMGATLYVGLTARTNEAGVEQLRAAVAPHGYRVCPVEVEGCLHLKSAVAAIADETVLLNPRWVDESVLEGLRVIEIHPEEPAAISVLRVGDSLLMVTGCPRTRATLEGAGCIVREIDFSELAKAEAGLTCCSILLQEEASGISRNRTANPESGTR